MTEGKLGSFRCSFALCTALAVAAIGCGGSGSSSTQAAPLKDRDRIAAALPNGVTLESPVVPDKLYGESSKTVEDALASFQAYVRDGVIRDGGMGHEIRFDAGSKRTKKTTKTKKQAGPVKVITLAH
jgi:hypothetical protein